MFLPEKSFVVRKDESEFHDYYHERRQKDYERVQNENYKVVKNAARKIRKKIPPERERNSHEKTKNAPEIVDI